MKCKRFTSDLRSDIWNLAEYRRGVISVALVRLFQELSLSINQGSKIPLRILLFIFFKNTSYISNACYFSIRKQRQKRYGLPILLHSCDHDANESVISQQVNQNTAAVLLRVITWHPLWKTVTGYPSNSDSCSSYVCWCINFTQDERHPIFTTASAHQPTSRHVLVCAPPAVDVTNGSARVWSLENVHFRVPGQEPGTVCHHRCMISLTLRL